MKSVKVSFTKKLCYNILGIKVWEVFDLKKDIRKSLISKLKTLSNHQSEKNFQEKILLEKFFTLGEWKEAKTIATTYPMAHEFDTKKLMRQAFIEQKTIAIPITQPGGVMAFYEYNEEVPLKLTKFGVYEPVTDKLIEKRLIDLMIVPGVGFTKEGKRIGYGGGFYDRYLIGYTGQTISLAFNEQLLDDLEIESHDKLVDYVIYPTKGEKL